MNHFLTLPTGEVCETANLRGHNMAGADRPKDWAELPNKPLMRRVKANVCRLLQGMAPGNFFSRWPLAGLSAMCARRKSYAPCYRTNERGFDNRRSLDGADSMPGACVPGSPRQPERRPMRSRGSHPPGWSKQHKDRLDPVRAVSKAARRLVNVGLEAPHPSPLPMLRTRRGRRMERAS